MRSLLLLPLCWAVTGAHPTGAPPEACTSMTPQHDGVAALSEPCPFHILTPNAYTPGQFVTVQIQQHDTIQHRGLKGILIQARKGAANHTTLMQNYIFGKFYSYGGNDLQGMSCRTQSGEDFTGSPGPNSITHTNSNNKSLPFNLTWMTHENVGPVVFVATFVVVKSTFWTYQLSRTLFPASDVNLDCNSIAKKECADGSCIDEWKNCPEDPCPLPGDYRCSNGTCGSFRCDNVTHCATAEDEACCQAERYQCASNRDCIDSHYICDNFPDCQNREDETGCNTFTCASNEFHCGSETCIPLHYLCDGMKDCSNGNDEDNCESSVTTTHSTADSNSLAISVVSGVISVGLLAGFCVCIAVCGCIYVRRSNTRNENNRSSSQVPAPNSSVQTLSLPPGSYPGSSTAHGGHTNLAYTSTSGSPPPGYSAPWQKSLGATNYAYCSEPPSYDEVVSGFNTHSEPKFDKRFRERSNHQLDYIENSRRESNLHEKENAQNAHNLQQERAQHVLNLRHSGNISAASAASGAISAPDVTSLTAQAPDVTSLTGQGAGTPVVYSPTRKRLPSETLF